VVNDGAGVRRVMAREVELVVDRLSKMEEIRPTHARRPVFGFLVFDFSFPSFPFSHARRSFFSLFFFFLPFLHTEWMEEGDRSESWSDSEIDPWSTTELESGGSRPER
jgi:hypothetical protein